MTNKEFKIWLAVNGHTQTSLALKLGITDQTITRYKKEGFPLVFELALAGLALESKEDQ